ncbi:unnamed protein product [Vitrella brassicaformis CCMP3155]|uniref:Uncharacterized protein n=2 Tax=Vitrella brassicaformis TaxID=1169539 RepID=A0A0G4GIE0_VITBC|nr:unnamed protein product [Vitrella brassicaformis CCMP3155]|mmetsp:Transcript_14056/g.40398  ORF Transcript_14056/g.40398 Transcript_14056/m.40398 type:complete len:762 (+) Transcript_14056:62-2347(+)|eukprot:CEM29613.1 unnamed protein product [Vitrella brassicaformis CCMP3155]
MDRGGRQKRSLAQSSAAASSGAAPAAAAAAAAASSSSAAAAGGGSDESSKRQRLNDDLAQMDEDEEVLLAMESMASSLRKQLLMIEQTKAKAVEILMAKSLMPHEVANTNTQTKVQAIRRHFRVWREMMQTNSARSQLSIERATQKLDMIQQKMQALNEEDRLSLDSIAEALWLSDGDRIGVGGYIGFVDVVRSLSAVSCAFRSMAKNPAMHPIVEFETAPSIAVAQRWISSLSRTTTMKIHGPPAMPKLILLEATTTSLQSMTLTSPLLTDRQERQAETALNQLPQPDEPIIFEHLHAVKVDSTWQRIPHFRRYRFPLLRELTCRSENALQQWVPAAMGGLHSIHMLFDRGRGGHTFPKSLERIGNVMRHTPTAGTLRSLTGHVIFHGEQHFWAILQSRLTTIEMEMPHDNDRTPIAHTSFIQRLHGFRSQCLEPDAVEVYHAEVRRVDNGRPDEFRCEELAVGLPLVGSPVQLAGTHSTVQKLANMAAKVSLSPFKMPNDVTMAYELNTAVFSCAETLTVKVLPTSYFPYTHLPNQLVSRIPAMLPAVRTFDIDQGTMNSDRTYEGGLHSFVKELPSLDRLAVKMTMAVDSDESDEDQIVPIAVLPKAIRHLAPQQGRRITVATEVEIERVSNAWGVMHDPPSLPVRWGVYEGAGVGDMDMGVGDDVREVIDNRVRAIEIKVSYNQTEEHARQLYTELLQTSRQMFDQFASLQCISYVHKPKQRWGPVRALRQAATQANINLVGEKNGTIKFTPVRVLE